MLPCYQFKNLVDNFSSSTCEKSNLRTVVVVVVVFIVVVAVFTVVVVVFVVVVVAVDLVRAGNCYGCCKI